MSQIDAAQVAVLAERVDRVLVNYDELRGLILAQNAQLSQVPLIAQQLAESNAKIDRIFATLKNHGDRLATLEKSMDRHQFIIRLTAAILMASVGLIGWGWRQGVQLYSTDAALDRRLLFIEYKLGAAAPQVEGGK